MLDFDANRHFLVDHIERVIYDRYDVSVVGAILVAAPAAITHAGPWTAVTIQILQGECEMAADNKLISLPSPR